jgi:SAM-dependent methyltransferase
VDPSPPTTDRRFLYDALAPIYDQWQAWNGMTPFAEVTHAKLWPVLEREARAIGNRDRFSFLDVACGTGALLNLLRDREPTWRLAGVDESAGMLAIAASKRHAATISWANAPLVGPLPFGPVDAAGTFYDTINHLPDAAALALAFGAFAQVLAPGGLLAFDVTNQLGFERWWRNRNDFEGNGWRLTNRAAFDPGSRTGTVEVTLVREGKTSRFRLTERLFTPNELTEALEAAGFEIRCADPWSPFDWDKPGKTWFLATKRH